MQGALIDTSVLLDLVLYYQQRHRRNRSVASSAAAAVETLLIYERPLLDPSSVAGIAASDTSSRFLRFYCDDSADDALLAFRQLTEFCQAVPLSPEEPGHLHSRALEMLAASLSPIENPDDLRAYELYDYLPYHMGEDPTAIECGVVDPSVADLGLVDIRGQGNETQTLIAAAEYLKTIGHPTRAAWALPLFRLYYYQALQEAHSVHLVPHATKSTIAFGREAETVDYRRLVDYCMPRFRESYLAHARRVLGGLMVLLPVPAVASALLRNVREWGDLVSRIHAIRESSQAVTYRRSLSVLLELIETSASFETAQAQLEDAYREVESQAREFGARLGLGEEIRHIRVALSLGPAIESHSSKRSTNNLLLVHDLFSASGIFGAAS